MLFFIPALRRQRQVDVCESCQQVSGQTRIDHVRIDKDRQGETMHQKIKCQQTRTENI